MAFLKVLYGRLTLGGIFGMVHLSSTALHREKSHAELGTPRNWEQATGLLDEAPDVIAAHEKGARLSSYCGP